MKDEKVTKKRTRKIKKESTPKKVTTKKDKTIKNTKPKKIKKESKIFTVDNILKLIFILLLILVIILGIMVFNKSKQTKKTKTANIAIPVYETSSQSSVTINAENLEKEYIIKVTNYKNNEINKTELKYNLNIINNTSSDVIVTKNNSSTNLMTDKKTTTIKEEKLQSNTKEDIYYHISVSNKDKIKNKENIIVQIES